MSTGNSPSVSVVMLAKNEARNLRANLDLILSQDVAWPYEVIIIDSGSTDGSIEFLTGMAARYPALRIHRIAPGDFHHARTRNLGAALAQGRYVVFLGGDAAPQGRDWLRNLVLPVLENAGVVASYGRQIPSASADISNYIRMTFNYPEQPMLKNKASGLSQKETYFFSSVNCCIDRERVSEPFFDDIVPVSEDITLSRRIIDLNQSTYYTPGAAVVHSHNYGSWEILQRYFDNVQVYRRMNILDNKKKSLADDGRRFLSYARRVLRNRPLADWLRFFKFLVFAGVGAKLGQFGEYLPAAIARRVSKYGVVHK